MAQRCTVHTTPQPGLCATCAQWAAGRRRRLRGLTVAAGVAAATVGIVVFLQTRPKRQPPPPKPEGDLLEGYKRERLAANPCDEAAVIDLVEYLEIHKRWQDALAVAEGSLAKCGELGDLMRHILRCHQQLHNWAEAATILEAQIAEDPRSALPWWEHGETWRYRSQNELALVDFRQALSNAFWTRTATLAVRTIMYAAEDVKAPCEADRAWRYYQRELGGRLDDEARNLVLALERDKTCVNERGTGKAKLVVGKRMRATIGKANLELMVDPRAGTTVLSRDAAERAGLVPTSQEKTATLWTDVRLVGQPARAARITVAGLAANNVDVVISDDLATGDDGVLGLSFLWHFDIERDGDEAVTLTPQR